MVDYLVFPIHWRFYSLLVQQYQIALDQEQVQLLNHLFRSGYNIPQEVLNRDYTETYQCSEEVQDVLIQVHRHDPTNAQLCELFVDLDEGLQEWRYRHIKMVQRTIGTKKGTGGSGVDYLLTTLSQSFFEDLWAIRANF